MVHRRRMLIDDVLRPFTRDASSILGAAAWVEVLSCASWLNRIDEVLEGAHIPHRFASDVDPTASVTCHADTKPCREDWYGTLEICPGEHAVVVRHIRLLSGFGAEALYLVASRDRRTLHATMARCRAAWQRWRRENAPARTFHDRPLEIPRVEWDDLCLPSRLLSELRTSIEGFAAAEPLYRRLKIPYRRGVLLYGPPGNGKSMLCRAVISNLGWPTVLFESTSGDFESELSAAFALASSIAPAVLIFEDVDSLFEEQSGLSAFLNELDGLESHEGILVLATTNHPEKLDAALTSRPSRFDMLFEVPDPARGERERYLARLFGDNLPADAIAELIEPTQGMSIAFLKELFVSACTRALARNAAQPSVEDARLALEQLSQHRKTVRREFATARDAGFTR
jgi:SpoVK/Ycf46/Vps4 family AAA+-type ATPase